MYSVIVLSISCFNILLFKQDGNTALLNACLNRKWNIARILLDHPYIDVAKCDNKGTTPLFAAVELNQLEITELLLEKRADVNGVRVSLLYSNNFSIMFNTL